MGKKDELDIDVQEVYSKAEDFLSRNSRKIYIGLGALALFIGGVLLFNYYQDGKDNDAAAEIWKAQYYYSVDSLDLAINGGLASDGIEYMGFEAIADEWSGTKNGELAKYYLGLCYRDKGEYETAFQYFTDCSLSSDLFTAYAYGNAGDCMVELEDWNGAITYFSKSISAVENDELNAVYLNKLGQVYEKVGEFNKAVEAYNRVIDNYDYPDMVDLVKTAKKRRAMSETRI